MSVIKDIEEKLMKRINKETELRTIFYNFCLCACVLVRVNLRSG